MRFVLLFCALFMAAPVLAAEVPSVEKVMADRVHGDPKAPVTIIEYASLTCSHCADFANKILPELEKTYVETGKVKIIYRDFPLDGIALRAAALARCLPEDRYFPFVKMLFQRQQNWARAEDPQKQLTQLAALAGLSPDVATACMNDMKILDAITKARTAAAEEYKISATPTFIFNDKAATIGGTRPLPEFTQTIDRLLGVKTPAGSDVKPVPAAPAAKETHEGHSH